MSARGPAFRERVRRAVADQALQAGLARVTERFSSARAQAFAAFPEGAALRQRARHIRLTTIRSLDRYVSQFASAARRAGARVHFASTASDANATVVEIVRTAGATRIVKSKSMVTEELELNRALETAGLRVVETDLGEFIVQLAGDRPSHIIVPVVHRTRADVAELFKARLGAGADEVADIPVMTALARRTLRDEFLHADVGISGANFAVAETGTLCLVTNEGNGRLTTTLPRVHIAMVGLERVVPTVEDLGVLLQLLARSATGQKLSVYTSLITGPRRRGVDGTAASDQADPDGPSELHIVLVDNGRSRILKSPFAEILCCIRCGACLNSCPVYRAIGGHAYGGVYPGPIGSVFQAAQADAGEACDLPHASTLCGACRDACPVAIDLPGLLVRLRARPEAVRRAPAWLRLGMAAFGFAATRPWLYRLAARAARVATRPAATEGWVRRLPGPLAGWTAHRDFPAFARRSFTEIWKNRESRP